jgi:ABC-type dipeptide/oligopeptide/nickel transport system permease subunit
MITGAALSFLGLGAKPPAPEWGAMLSEARNYLRLAPWTTTFPGLAIVVAALAINLLGDGLRDALDPRTNR